METLYTKFYLRSARRFKQNLRYYRKGLGLTQEDFAEQCGISAHYVATLEAPGCSTFPSFEMLHILAFHLGVEVLALFWTEPDLPF